jgi:Na+/melibiose symporter-like transporter
MLNNLMSTHPFTKAVQYTAYLLLGCLLGGITLMRPVPESQRAPKSAEVKHKTDMKSLFENKGYAFLTAGLCLSCLGAFFPSFYLQIFASERGVDAELTSYTVAIINAASTLGTSVSTPLPVI